MLNIWWVIATLASGALAQDEAAEAAEGDAPAADAPADDVNWKEAIELPRRAKELRELGLPPEEVGQAIRAVRLARLSADETKELLESSKASAGEHGPVENFGAFVQAQLDEGKRGPELAAAIKAAHAERGIGAGKKLESKGKPHHEPAGHGGAVRPQAGGDAPAGGGAGQVDLGGAGSIRTKAKRKAKGAKRKGGK